MKNFQLFHHVLSVFFLFVVLVSAQSSSLGPDNPNMRNFSVADYKTATTSCPPQPTITRTVSMCAVTKVYTTWVTPSIATSIAIARR